MGRNKVGEESIRKLFKKNTSLCVSLPIEIVREMKLRGKQKVVVKKKDDQIIITDWKK